VKRSTPLRAGSKSTDRGSTFQQRAKSRARKPANHRWYPDALDPAAQEMRGAWSVFARQRPCAACGAREHIEGHHAIPLGVLKREGVPQRFWFDTRNCVSLCSGPAPNRCHDRHENHVRRVPRSVVLLGAPDALAFADEVGLRVRFDHEYPVQPESRESA